MKIIYTNENSLLVNNMQNLLEQAGIETKLKNEFIRSALGELAVQQSWLELWVLEDSQFEEAQSIIDSATIDQSLTVEEAAEKEWSCNVCKEKNSHTFQFCWNCETDEPSSKE